MKHLNIRVKGRVQGVGFRYAAHKAANSYKISGFVRNEPDGTVYIEAEGEEMNVDLFLKWCETGPGYGRVDHVVNSVSGLQGFDDFRILH